jgi:solute carrier family 25 glutamate transporter 18/22
VATKIFKEKGLKGLYQGGTATLVRDVSFSAMYFPLFAYFNSQVKTRLFLFNTYQAKKILKNKIL